MNDLFGTHTVVRGPSITSGVHTSEEIRAAAATYRARGAPGDADVADRLEEAARNAATRASVWQLAGYSAQEQPQLAEFWWRNELAIARVLRPESDREQTRQTGPGSD
jgi:tRNA U34 5-methylaminomethyl-2-thiouridine-forming methyltransferase MnmC